MERVVYGILGCTASGKGAVARILAETLGGEIVSIDSMKVYRGMDIGTAKPSLQERAGLPHHLIDVADPWESFSAARFVGLADAAIESIHQRGRPVVGVGGTILYFRCLYEGMLAGPSASAEIRTELRARAERDGLETLHAELQQVDPAAAARIHRQDLRRIERALEVHRLTGRPLSEQQQQWDREQVRRADWDWRLIGLRRPREAANRRINERVRKLIAAGLVDEARRLWTDPRGMGEQARQAVGYAELFRHFRGELTLDEAIEKIKIHSRRLAKHQRTWLKRFGKIRWIEVAEDATPEGLAAQALEMFSKR